VKNSSRKRRKKRNSQESCQERFLDQKNKFLKTGITNLAPPRPASDFQMTHTPSLSVTLTASTAKGVSLATGWVTKMVT
jgi:hypothetical protein